MRPARIQELFDVRQRHWSRGTGSPDCSPGEGCSDLAAEAGRRAIGRADIDAGTIDTLVCVSTTPDYVSPSMDYLVGTKLGLRGTRGVDIRGACAGTFRALELVVGLMRSGMCERALIVASETMSPFFRFGPDTPKDHRFNSVLYGDGAGAIVVVADEGLAGIDSIVVRTTGESPEPGITAPGMMSAMPPTLQRFESMEYLGYHDYRRVLRRGTELTWHAASEIFSRTGTTVADFDFFLTHQATGRLHEIGARYGIRAEQLPTNIERVGNTVSASILILLDELNAKGALAEGQRLLLFSAESSTWSYGATALRWG